MPARHCQGGDRYKRVAREGVRGFATVTAQEPRRVVVQAGGHVGWWPQYLAEYFDTVLTFEPHAANYRCLAANVTAPNVYPMRAVLGERSELGGAQLHHHGGNTGGHHLEPPQRDTDPAQAVPMLALDSLRFHALDALVLDCEGAELLVVEGAEQTLMEHRPVLLLEERGHIEKKVQRGTTATLHETLGMLGYTAGQMLGHDRLWWPT